MLFKDILKRFVFPSLLLFSQVAISQGKVITGKVTDSKDGTPLRGVTILASGTETGTETQADGTYQISVSPSVTTLVFSSVGYIPQEVSIQGRSQINVTMDIANSVMSEVVVIGYGTAKKKDLTGSVASVSAKDFNKGAVTTPEQLISGKVAGVSITKNDGAPGSGSIIRIRGGSSLNASNDPLIVIDGMPLSNSSIAGVANAMVLLNPNDIASFTILKDASATAIYGSRASNGVIIITTKKGQRGKPKFSFTSQVSAGILAKKFSVLSPTQFSALVNKYGDANQRALLGSYSTDWQDYVYQTAVSNDNNLSVSGSLKKFLTACQLVISIKRDFKNRLFASHQYQSEPESNITG